MKAKMQSLFGPKGNAKEGSREPRNAPAPRTPWLSQNASGMGPQDFADYAQGQALGRHIADRATEGPGFRKPEARLTPLQQKTAQYFPGYPWMAVPGGR